MAKVYPRASSSSRKFIPAKFYIRESYPRESLSPRKFILAKVYIRESYPRESLSPRKFIPAKVTIYFEELGYPHKLSFWSTLKIHDKILRSTLMCFV